MMRRLLAFVLALVPLAASAQEARFSVVNLGRESTIRGAIKFFNESNNNAVSMRSGLTSTAYTLTLPLTAGTSGTYLRTSGAGVLEFSNPLTIGNPVVDATTYRLLYVNASGLLANTAHMLVYNDSELSLGTGSTTTGGINFFNLSNNNYVTLKPGATSATYTLTMPTAAGASGTFLGTSGSGTLNFSNPLTIGNGVSGATTMRLLYVNAVGQLTEMDEGTINAAELTLGAGTSLPGSVKLRNSVNNNYVRVRSGTTSTSYDFVLPTNDGGPGQALSTDGTGITSWQPFAYFNDSLGLAGYLSDATGTGYAVFNTSPTIVTPTIASFINAAHNHTNAAGGAQITDAALSAAVGTAKGGTGQTTYSIGDVLIGADGGSLDKVPVGADWLVLTVDSGTADVGVKWAAQNERAQGGTIASGSTLTLASVEGMIHKTYHVSGTTTITAISGAAANPGMCVALIFDGALTLTDGGALKLAGDFVTTADDVWSGCTDGTNWYETSRSVN